MRGAFIVSISPSPGCTPLPSHELIAGCALPACISDIFHYEIVCGKALAAINLVVAGGALRGQSHLNF
jgi:hypothetical protein